MGATQQRGPGGALRDPPPPGQAGRLPGPAAAPPPLGTLDRAPGHRGNHPRRAVPAVARKPVHPDRRGPGLPGVQPREHRAGNDRGADRQLHWRPGRDPPGKRHGVGRCVSCSRCRGPWRYVTAVPRGH